MMSPRFSYSSSHPKSASSVDNTIMKRLFSKTDNDYMHDEFDSKRQKTEKHSVKDINDATIAVTSGYMTRHRLNKQFKNDCCETIESKDISVKAKRKRNKTSKDSSTKKRIQRGYVFTQDIYSTKVDKNLVTQRKSAPALFESDTELYLNIYQLDTSITSAIKEETINPKIEPMNSAFSKSQVKTYSNKKLGLSNNKSNSTIIILNDLDKNDGGANINVTESLIKQLKNEFQTKNMITEDKSLCHELPSEKNSVEYVLNVEEKKDNVIKHNYEVKSPVNESKSSIHELSSETNTIKSVLNIEEKKDTEERNSEVYQYFDVADNLSNEINELNNLLSFELENIKSDETSACLIDDVSSCNGILLNHNEKVDDLDKLLQFNNTSLVANNYLFSIFDPPESETLMESCTEIKQNYQSSISGSETSNVISNEMTETNNCSTNKFNNGNLDDIIDDSMPCNEELSSSCHNDSLLEQDTNSYDSIKPKSPNFVFENTSPRIIDLPDEKPNLNKNYSCFEAETLTDISEEITALSNNLQLETECNDSQLVNSTDLNKPVKPEKSTLKNIDVTRDNFISIFDLPNEKTTVQSFADAEQNENLYSGSKMSTNFSKEVSEPNNVKICTIENNITGKYVKNFRNYSPNKSKKEKDNCLALQDKMSSNLLTNQYVPTVSSHNKKRKSDSFINEKKDFNLIGNENLEFEINNSSKKPKNLQHDSKCLCKVFYCFNKDANQILTSKVKHFAFNTVAKNVRQKLHDLKNLEASLLKILINSEKKYIVQSDNLSPLFKPVPNNMKCPKLINSENNSHIEPKDLNIVQDPHVDVDHLFKKHQKSINSKKNDHIEPKILSILKDAYVDVDYLSDYDYNKDGTEILIQQNVDKSNNLNIQSTKKKLTNDSHLVTNNNEKLLSNISNNYQVEIDASSEEEKNNFTKLNARMKNNSFSFKGVFQSSGKNLNFDSKNEIKLEENCHDSVNEPDFKLKPLPYCQSDEPILSAQKNNFIQECKKSLTNANNNLSESINILPGKIETNSVFSSIEKVQLVKNELEHVTDSISSHSFESSCKSLFDISNCTMKNLHDYSSDDDYKFLSHVLPSETNTANSIVLNIEEDEDSKVHYCILYENPDFELKPLPYCQPNELNNLVFENNSFNNEDGNKFKINQKNNHNEPQKMLSDEIETKTMFSQTEAVQFLKDELKLATDPDFEFKPLPYCKPNEPNNLVIENNSFNYEECDKSEISLKNNHNEPKEMSGDIKTKSVFSQEKTVQFLKDDIDLKLVTGTDFELNPLSYCKPNEPNNLVIENNNFSYEECDKSEISLKNNHNEPKEMLSGDIETTSVFSQEKTVQFLKDDVDLKLVKGTDFELNPLLYCKPNEPNNLVIENNNFNDEECDKSEINQKNNHKEPEKMLSDETETKSMFSQTKSVQFLKDDLKHVTDCMSHNFEPSSKSLFDLSNYDMESVHDCSSDDDNKLQINDDDSLDSIDKNSTTVHSVLDNSQNTIARNNLSSMSAATDQLSNDVQLLNNINNNAAIVNKINQDNSVLKSNLLKEEKSSFINQKCNVKDPAKEEKKSIENCLFMTIEMCNNYYEKRIFNKDVSKNKYEHFTKNVTDIFKEMFVDEMFLPSCQHIIDLCDDNQLEPNDILFSKDNKNVYTIPENKINGTKTKNGLSLNISINTKEPRPHENLNCDENNTPSQHIIETNNFHPPQKLNEQCCMNETTKELVVKTEIMNCKANKSDMIAQISYFKQNKELEQSCSTNTDSEENKKIAFENKTVYHKHNETIMNLQNKSSLQENSLPKTNAKTNIKVRLHLRDMIISDNPLNIILESKEFRNLRFFNEEEISCSIGVFLFEQIIDAPKIIGLSAYKENYDHLNNEEKCKLLRSTELKIICPKITKLTSITLALSKMLRSNSLIERILITIQKNLFTKPMNTDHSITHQLMKFIAYFVDICTRLRLLKNLQTFIFDSMVMIPNKYCCVIFISLLMWKNCLPVSLNDEQDPVIITVLSHLIIKKKLYAEQTFGGCDIFCRELINLLTVHFNYSFTLDLPSNMIHRVHKPDFFVSVAMFLKCAHPKDLVEFIDVCLLPIIEDYLNTQHNDANAIKTMELINMVIKPFRGSCNTTVSSYLTKFKKLAEKTKNDKKEHIYNIIYNCYKRMQNKFISYLHDNRTRSQLFEELLVSIIIVLGSVDYLTSCVTLMKWNPNFQPSTIVSEQLYMFKSILGHTAWDRLSAMDDTAAVEGLINSYLLGKNEFTIFERIHAARWKLINLQ